LRSGGEKPQSKRREVRLPGDRMPTRTRSKPNNASRRDGWSGGRACSESQTRADRKRPGRSPGPWNVPPTPFATATRRLTVVQRTARPPRSWLRTVELGGCGKESGEVAVSRADLLRLTLPTLTFRAARGGSPAVAALAGPLNLENRGGRWEGSAWIEGGMKILQSPCRSAGRRPCLVRGTVRFSGFSPVPWARSGARGPSPRAWTGHLVLGPGSVRPLRRLTGAAPSSPRLGIGRSRSRRRQRERFQRTRKHPAANFLRENLPRVRYRSGL
jgi:hypothetical protein